MSKPKKPKPPPTPAPQAQVIEATETADETVRKARRRSGYQSTFLAGSLAPSTGKRTVLG